MAVGDVWARADEKELYPCTTRGRSCIVGPPPFPLPPVVLDSAVRAAISRAVASEIGASEVTDGCEPAGERGATVGAGVVCSGPGEEGL